MKILKLSEDHFRLTLSPAEVRILVNSMNETMKEIADYEYATRMGATKDEIKSAITELDAAITSIAQALPQAKGEWVRVPRGK